MHIFELDARQIHGRSLARLRAIHRYAAGMQSAHARAFALWKQLHFLFRRDRARYQCSGDHRPEPLHGESPVNRQAKMPRQIFFRRTERHLQQLPL